jgi:ABC-type Fe3+ transport system permease subunit
MHTPHPHWLDSQIHHETMNSILIGLAAVLGMTFTTGLMAIIIRLASGRW